MKYLLFILIAISIISPSCNKSSKTATATTYTNTGYIKGPNLSMTVCGGSGYWIVIDSDLPTIQTFVDSLPAGSGINLATATFPVYVKFNFHSKAAPNPCGYIVIDAIEKTK